MPWKIVASTTASTVAEMVDLDISQTIGAIDMIPCNESL
jgi:hypothetical protein